MASKQRGVRSRSDLSAGGGVTIGGGFLPAGGDRGRAAYVDPLHPNAADDAALDTPFLTPQGAADALAAVLVPGDDYGAILLAAGRFVAGALVLAPGIFWSVLPIDGWAMIAGNVTLQVGADDAGLAIGGLGFGAPGGSPAQDVGMTLLGDILVVDVFGGGGDVDLRVADVALKSGDIDASAHGGVQTVEIWRSEVVAITLPDGVLRMHDSRATGAVTTSIYALIRGCTFAGAAAFTIAVGSTGADAGFYSCQFTSGGAAFSAPGPIFFDPVTLASFELSGMSFAGGAILNRRGNVETTLYAPVNLPTGVLGNMPVVSLAADGSTATIGFRLPGDYPPSGQSIVGHLLDLRVVAVPSAGGAGLGRVFAVETRAGAIGEAETTHVDGPTNTAAVDSGTVGFYFSIPILTRIPDARAGDYVSVQIANNVGNGGVISIVGLFLTYRAQ